MNPLGAIKITVRRGIELKICDAFSSDSYVVISSASQTKMTRVINNNGDDPEWNEELTINIFDTNQPIYLAVFDQDTFTSDDKMGDTRIDIKPYIECLRTDLDEVEIGTTVKVIQPNDENCLADESRVMCIGQKIIIQEMILKLQNVDTGKLQIQIEWLDLPDGTGLTSSTL